MAKSILTSTFLQLRDKLHSIASGITGSGEDADDVLHDVFCKLWVNHRSLQDEEEVTKISIAAVHNTSIDKWRKRNSHPTVSQENMPDITVVDEKEIKEEREALYQSLLQLSRKILNDIQYEIFILHDVENMSYVEIAEKTGLTQVNIRKILSRSRKAIREAYRCKIDR